MPELPEVEHVVRALRPVVVGRRILAAELNLKRISPEISRPAFARRLKDLRVNAVGRRGKYILFELDSGALLTTHLRMTGKFVALGTDDELPPYAHVVFHLDDDQRLVFCDMRQFGRMRIVSNSQKLPKELLALAPEPLSDEFTEEYFLQTLRKSRRSLKSLLLDQTRVLGLGNIYAVEALFLAGIHPLKQAHTLSKPRARKLFQAIKTILQEAIDSGSTLRIDLSDGESSYIGSSERFWRVYEREGEPCVKCGTKIRRVAHGGRSTYFCPKCQR
ncbi:MAG TPA: bifunctional DNA-formamidopyrimidine glycosylase/DNA-(apurinic or apyrimidinic site) lyase [Pyrinomonadaceae bacterium]|jgi:formamidopyrimidine-DNA glycosylase (fpg)|nr:bifunctional DNA-formamidopyrimidine glycosylase/DNA-(apurinic or apyrimidinic site) lyase [Pyrinomonadaceae bacterium]